MDLVVIGGFWGKGKRENLLGAYLLGAFDRKGKIHPITKVGTGFSEEDLEYWN